MKNSHLPIDQRHKELLRATLLKTHSAQTFSADRKIHSFSMKTLFRLSFIPALAVAGFGAWLVFLPQNHTQSGLSGVRAALAAEAAQAAQHLVHHQKITITDSTEPDHVLIEEQWQKDLVTAHSYMNADGSLDDKSLITYAADGAVASRYELRTLSPSVSGNAMEREYCLLNTRDITTQTQGAAAAQEKIDSLGNLENISDRQALITTLLNDSHVQDLGERNGSHIFSLSLVDEMTSPVETTRYEYAFDPVTYSLKTYSIHYFSGTANEYTYTYEYSVNEYLSESVVSQNIWSTDGLHAVSNDVNGFANMASGCYSVDGTKIAELHFTTEVRDDGRFNVVIDQTQNEFMDNLIFIQHGSTEGIYAFEMIRGDMSKPLPDEATSQLITVE